MKPEVACLIVAAFVLVPLFVTIPLSSRAYDFWDDAWRITFVTEVTALLGFVYFHWGKRKQGVPGSV